MTQLDFRILVNLKSRMLVTEVYFFFIYETAYDLLCDSSLDSALWLGQFLLPHMDNSLVFLLVIYLFSPEFLLVLCFICPRYPFFQNQLFSFLPL